MVQNQKIIYLIIIHFTPVTYMGIIRGKCNPGFFTIDLGINIFGKSKYGLQTYLGFLEIPQVNRNLDENRS